MKRPRQQIKKRDIDRALRNTAWDLGNRVLYRLCRRHPDHDNIDVVIAKIWLIGRAYSAAIERGRNPTSKGDFFYVKEVAPKMSILDRWLADLPSSRSPDQNAIISAISVHEKLTSHFAKIAKQPDQKRSLASKYLHFHRPYLFFIYDSRAAKAISATTPDDRYVSRLGAKSADSAYLSFYRRCLWLRDDLRSRFGVDLPPRKLDKLLLYIAN
jgi:hypothetical protein